MNLPSVITELLSFVGNLFCSSKCGACHGYCITTKTSYGPLKSICRRCWSEITANSPQVSWLSMGSKDIAVASGCYYTGPTKKLIYHLKYDGDTRLAGDLSLLLISAWPKLTANKRVAAFVSGTSQQNNRSGCGESLLPAPENCIIVPIPMHHERYRQRGYNQAELLANKLGAFIKAPIVSAALSRVINTAPQYGLSRKQRKENLRGAFLANQELIKGRDVIVVDDIFTSGATISEACAELHRQGAKSVHAITLARAV
jgi:ComF family protein